MTMRDVGGVFPSVPTRTPFTPAASTAMCRCPDASAVAGKSTTMRAGASSVLSFGVTVPRALISTRISSVPRTTLTRSSWPGVWAAMPATSSIDEKIVSSCFRISPLPNPQARARESFLPLDFGGPLRGVRRPLVYLNLVFVFLVLLNLALLLYRRGKDPLHHFAGEWLTQLVLHRFLEHHRVSGDLHHIAVEHGIVLAQEIGLVQAVGDDGDEAVVGLHHAPQIDVANLQAFLSRRASRAA